MAKQYEDTISEDDLKGGENLSQKQLVMALIKKINDENFKRADNLVIETKRGLKIIDIRETRISGIKDLNTLLQPEYDEQMKKYKKQFDEKLKTLEARFYEVSIILKAEEIVQKFRGEQQRQQQHKAWCDHLKKMGYLSIQKETPEFDGYLERKSELFQELFEQLIYLLDRNDWLCAREEKE